MSANIKRLELLQDLMKNHDKHFPKVQFNIGTWANRLYDTVFKPKQAKTCVSAACALGSAACYRPFIKEGLQLFNDVDWGVLSVKFGDYEDFEAGEKFFGINSSESAWLFNPGEYGTSTNNVKPQMVAYRVAALIQAYTVFNKPLFNDSYELRATSADYGLKKPTEADIKELFADLITTS